MQRALHCAGAALLFTVSAITQVAAVQSDEVRKATRLLYGFGVQQPAELCIQYGAAVWRAAHDSEVGRKAAAHFRLGSGYWTTLHNDVELVFGDKRVPPGTWYLGLFRTDRAQWELSLVHSSKVQRAGLTSGSTRDVRPDVLVPLRLKSGKESAAELRIVLQPVAQRLGHVRLLMRWGEYEASTQFDAKVEAGGAAGEPKFAKLDPSREIETKSGLRYEEIRPGIGELPGPASKVTVHYVGWLEDGTRFDSSFDRKQPTTFPLNAVIKGWQEGVAAMKPGAVFRMVIPPELAYGERGAGPIKPNSTLVFWIQLLAVE